MRSLTRLSLLLITSIALPVIAAPFEVRPIETEEQRKEREALNSAAREVENFIDHSELSPNASESQSLLRQARHLLNHAQNAEPLYTAFINSWLSRKPSRKSMEALFDNLDALKDGPLQTSLLEKAFNHFQSQEDLALSPKEVEAFCAEYRRELMNNSRKTFRTQTSSYLKALAERPEFRKEVRRLYISQYNSVPNRRAYYPSLGLIAQSRNPGLFFKDPQVIEKIRKDITTVTSMAATDAEAKGWQLAFKELLKLSPDYDKDLEKIEARLKKLGRWVTPAPWRCTNAYQLFGDLIKNRI